MLDVFTIFSVYNSARCLIIRKGGFMFIVKTAENGQKDTKEEADQIQFFIMPGGQEHQCLQLRGQADIFVIRFNGDQGHSPCGNADLLLADNIPF